MDGASVLNYILVICGAITLVGGAVAVIAKWISPIKRLTNRILKLEEHTQENYCTLNKIAENQSVMIETLLYLLNSQISGNDIDKVKEIRNKIISHLAKRGNS